VFDWYQTAQRRWHKNHLKAETWKRLPEVVSGEAVVLIVVVVLTPVFEMEYV